MIQSDSPANVTLYMNKIEELLKVGSDFLLNKLGSGVVEVQKGSRDFALNTDIELERIYRDELLRSFPQIPILGEELSPDAVSDDSTGLCWAIDPIDGTANYARNISIYGTSIALVKNGKPIASGLSFPSLNETYIAGHGMGAFLNGKRIYVSDINELSSSILTYGDFAVGPDRDDRNKARFQYIETFGHQVHRVRMLGSAALHLAWVAAGRADVSLTLSNNAWDVQGGVLLVREAGGDVYDVDGSDHTILSKYTFASNQYLKKEVLKIVSDIDSSLK